MCKEHTAHCNVLHQYHGAGMGLILNMLVLSNFLASTLGVLMHTSQNVLAWLFVITPNVLELAVTLGTYPISRMTVLELTVVVLNTCM
jgi:telomere length regulation protein